MLAPALPAAAPAAAAAAARAAAETAMPSIAEQSDRGDGQRATIGPAPTRPSAPVTGTRSMAGLASQPALSSESSHSAQASAGRGWALLAGLMFRHACHAAIRCAPV